LYRSANIYSNWVQKKFCNLSLYTLYILCVQYISFVSLLHQGPEPRSLIALQPLGLLYVLFSRRSHCRRQMSPRPTCAIDPSGERGNFNVR
jgi:hypothetical protein